MMNSHNNQQISLRNQEQLPEHNFNLQKRIYQLQKKIETIEQKNKSFIRYIIILAISLFMFVQIRSALHNKYENKFQLSQANVIQKQHAQINSVKNPFTSNSVQVHNNSTASSHQSRQISSLKQNIQQIESTLQYLFNIYKNQLYTNRLETLKKAKIHKNLGLINVTKMLELQSLNYQFPFGGQVLQKYRHDLFKNISAKQYKEYDQKYKISAVKKQNPFCIIIPTWNNAPNLRYQLNLKSILIQNYTNFHVHIIDDMSDDQTFYLLRRYLRAKNISNDKVTLDKPLKRSFMLKNIVSTAKKYCKPEEIIAVIDGDDQLLGANVLNLFNSFYQKQKLGVVYSNNLKFHNVQKLLRIGLSKQYPGWAIKQNAYRKAGFSHSQLRTFRAQLLFGINQTDFKMDGEYMQYGSDNAIMFPIQQMSCGRIKYVNEINYFVNVQTFNNDYQKGHQKQLKTQQYINGLTRYKCKQSFK